jgi:hypothetical protein
MMVYAVIATGHCPKKVDEAVMYRLFPFRSEDMITQSAFQRTVEWIPTVLMAQRQPMRWLRWFQVVGLPAVEALRCR